MNNKIKIVIGLTALTFILLLSVIKPSLLDANNLSVVKDTLQHSKLSVAGRVKSPTAVGTSHIYMYTTAAGGYNTLSTANMKAGDTVVINSHSYTVVNIINGSEFNVSPVLLAGDATDTTPFYIKSTPQHDFSFNTASAQPGGFFRVLIPAAASNSNDGNPDTTGFDYNSSVTVSVTDTTGYDFVAGVSTPSGAVGCTTYGDYHCFEFHYSGNGGINTPINIKVGTTAGSGSLIAPAPSDTVEATGENYTYKVQQYDSGGNLQDSSNGRVALIEAVRVTVTVDPSINFTIAGVNTAGSACGVTPSIDTTTGINSPLAVPFGILTLNNFKTAAHLLTVSTNAANGYAVTAVENMPLGKDGSTAPYIADTGCDTGPCTITTPQQWIVPTNSGFGYSLENINAASVAFTYGGAGNFSAKKFPALSRTEAAQIIFSSTTTANAEAARVCYRIAVNSSQAAGDYENQITYTATATF